MRTGQSFMAVLHEVVREAFHAVDGPPKGSVAPFPPPPTANTSAASGASMHRRCLRLWVYLHAWEVEHLGGRMAAELPGFRTRLRRWSVDGAPRSIRLMVAARDCPSTVGDFVCGRRDARAWDPVVQRGLRYPGANPSPRPPLTVLLGRRQALFRRLRQQVCRRLASPGAMRAPVPQCSAATLAAHKAARACALSRRSSRTPRLPRSKFEPTASRTCARSSEAASHRRNSRRTTCCGNVRVEREVDRRRPTSTTDGMMPPESASVSMMPQGSRPQQPHQQQKQQSGLQRSNMRHWSEHIEAVEAGPFLEG